MQLPEMPARTTWVKRYAGLLASFSEELGTRPLVRQTAEFFPDPFAGDEVSVARVLQRLQAHAGMADVPIRLALLVGEGGAGPSGGCGTSGCGAPAALPPGGEFVRLREEPNRWVVSVLAAEAQHPVALTTLLALCLARIFMLETEGAEARYPGPLEEDVELVAVALGMGLLVLEGSYVYAKSCGGPSVQQWSRLSVGQLSLLTALFMVQGGHAARPAIKALSTTQRSLLSEAYQWARSNRHVLSGLSTNPQGLEVEKLKQTRGWLEVVWSERKRADPSAEPTLESLEAWATSRALAPASGASAVRDPKREELKALVQDAFEGT